MERKILGLRIGLSRKFGSNKDVEDVGQIFEKPGLRSFHWSCFLFLAVKVPMKRKFLLQYVKELFKL